MRNRISGFQGWNKLTALLSILPWPIFLAIGALILLPGCPENRGVITDLPHGLLRVPRCEPRVTAPPPLPAPSVPAPPRQAYRNVTIILDPGHGGHDPGTRGIGYSNIPEKTINLAIATNLAQQLRSRGVNVVMTRSGDWFVELGNRAAMGDRYNAELFVSIHIDASRNSGASGMTVYMGKSASVGSQQAAQHINNALRAAGLETRGVRRANYKVLRESNCSAVLVECGYLSNYGDARQLNTPYHQQRVAAAIAEGIANYFGW